MSSEAPALMLTRPELEELCDTVQPKRMTRWLEAQGWVFEPPRSRGGLPKVDRAYYLSRMSGKAESPRRVGPTLDFMFAPR